MSGRRRARLFASAWALAGIGLPALAQGQAFPAKGTVVQGSAQITTGSNATNIAVGARETVINWTLDPVVFGGGQFRNPTLNTDVPYFAFAGRAAGAGAVVPYTPSGPIFAPDGLLNFLPAEATATFSGVGAAAGGYTVLNRVLIPGRSVFNGIVQSFVGQNPGGNVWFYNPAGIVVGPNAQFRVGSLVLTTSDIDTSGGLFGAGGAIRFRGAAASTAAVDIRPGAQLSALGGADAYLAIVAPRIVQAGAIRTTGSAALVAAEQADIRINAGLLDIVVTQGTTDPNGIIHTGTTTGTAAGGSQAISFVAVPKNDAITMLLAGTIGYAAAAQAATDGTAIVLSSGVPASGGGAPRSGSILIGDAAFTSPLVASASDTIEVAPTAQGLTDFRGGARLAAGRAVRLTAVAGARIDAAATLAIAAGGAADGQGGTAAISAAGGSIAATRLAIDASGTGSGGGDGTGGTIALSASAGGTIAAAQVDATANGSGGAANGAGGKGVGGSVTLGETDGRLAFGAVTLAATGTGGSGAAGGSARIHILSQPQSWGSLAIDASALGTAGEPHVGGTIAVTLGTGGALALAGDFSAKATGDTPPTAPGFALQVAGSRFAVGGSARIESAGDVVLSLAPGGRLDTGGDLAIATPRGLTATGPVSAGGSVSLIADRGIGLTALDEGGVTLLQALAGPVTVSQDLRSSGPVTVRGRTIDLTATGALRFAAIEASGGGLALRSGGDLDLGAVTATGDVGVVAGGSIRAGAVAGANLSLAAGGDLVADGAVTAADVLRLRAGNRVVLNAAATGTTIAVDSADIAIGALGKVGARGTTESIALTNIRPGRPTAIGGAGQADAFSLDAGEVGRLFADRSITIAAAPVDGDVAADVLIGDLALAFGPDGNIGSGGALRFQTPGRLAVRGAVRLATSDPGDSLAIDAQRIDIAVGEDAGMGSIALRGAGGVLQGQLDLTADTVSAAGTAATALIARHALPVAIESQLDLPGAVPSNAGYLQAGQIAVSVADGFFVQNSGSSLAYAARRGFSANSLAITTRSAAALIAINGRVFGPQGVALGGLDTARAVQVNGVAVTAGRGRFDPLSSLNGCLIGRNCRVLPADSLPPRMNMAAMLDGRQAIDIIRVSEIAERLDQPDGISLLDRNDTLSEPDRVEIAGLMGKVDVAVPMALQVLPYLLLFEQPDPARQQPLIDEPVTGVGNDDLWLGNCDPSRADCPAKEGPAPSP